MKQEFYSEKRMLEQKLFEFEVEKNNSRRNEKLLEERMKYMSEDKEKQEKVLVEKWKIKVDEKEEAIKNLEVKIKEIELQVK